MSAHKPEGAVPDTQRDPRVGEMWLIGKHKIKGTIRTVEAGNVVYTVPSKKVQLICESSIFEWRRLEVSGLIERAEVIRRAEE